MKRSEMVTTLAMLVPNKEKAETILSTLEGLGMKPPCSCHDDIEHTKEKGYGPRCGISWHLSEWEEE